MKSLAYHCKLYDGLREDGPTPVEMEAILSIAEGMFEDAKWSVPKDFLDKSHYERVVRTKLDWTSSPGFPYMRKNPTNSVLFKVKDGEPDQVRIDEIWSIVNRRLEERDCDPIRLFVKPEPHKMSKLENHRYRLISSVSVVDQIIDHMLFDAQNDTMIANWPYLPTWPGWAPVVGGWKALIQQIWMATDKSGWDWSARAWVLELVLRLRARLGGNDRWAAIAAWRYQALFLNPTFVTSGGLLFRQRRRGVQKSGCVNTIADNSMAQVLLHIRVCLKLGLPVTKLLAMGDDVLQEPVANEKEYLRLLGEFCHVKQAAHVNEFAGCRFLGKRVEPMYKGKHAFNILHVDEEIIPQLADSYTLQYHRSSYRDWMRNLFRGMGAEVRPIGWNDMVFDGM